MTETIRFGVSIDSKLLDNFDQSIKNKGYENRSEALRDLIRDFLVKEKILRDEQIAGVISIVYDHHEGDLSKLLTEIQHDHVDIIISTLHVHLDHHNCLEVIVVKGQSNQVKAFSDSLSIIKGIKHCDLVITGLGDL